MTIYRCSATGTSAGTDEFQFGLHLSRIGGTVDGALAAFTAFVDNLWNGDGSSIGGIGQYYPTSTQIQSLVATSLSDLTGKNVAQAVGAVTQTGTGSGQALPGEVAVCVSLRTGIPTRAGRGRFFLPNPIVSVMFLGGLETSVVADVVEAAQYGLNNLVSSTYVPVVYHRTDRTATNITSVDVGDIPDVQRRRRNKLVEARQSLPVS